MHCIFNQVDFFCFDFSTSQWYLGELQKIGDSDDFFLENSHTVSAEKSFNKSSNFNVFATGGLEDSFGALMASKKVFVASFYTNIDAVTQIKMQFKTLPDLPESLFYHQSALIKDAKGDTNLLVFGGLSAFGNYEGQESRNQVHSFNLQAEFKAQANFESFYDNRTKTNWVERAPMNEKRAGFSSVVTQSQLLYVFGGHNQGKLASIAIERFNINQNIWTPIPLKIDDQDFTSLIGAAMTTDPANEKVYILGGSDGQVL